MNQLIQKIIPTYVLRALRLWVRHGSVYHCPFCDYSSKALCPVGEDLPILKEKHVIGAGRRNGGCYKCQSLDRERLVYAYLKHKADLLERPSEKSILHIAPEFDLSRYLIKQGFKEYICGDLFTNGYAYPDHVQNMNVTEIPSGADRFDLVICNHVLEHVPDDQLAMREIRRVLKPGGKAILQVPISWIIERTEEDPSITDPKLQEALFGQFDHVRIYGPDYFDRLKSAGFTVQILDLFREFEHYGLNPEESIFIGTK